MWKRRCRTEMISEGSNEDHTRLLLKNRLIKFILWAISEERILRGFCLNNNEELNYPLEGREGSIGTRSKKRETRPAAATIRGLSLASLFSFWNIIPFFPCFRICRSHSSFLLHSFFHMLLGMPLHETSSTFCSFRFSLDHAL